MMTPRYGRAGHDVLAVVGAGLLVLLGLYGSGTDAASCWSFVVACPYATAAWSLTGHDQAWTVAAAITLTLPTIWMRSLPVLGALPSLVGRRPSARWTSALCVGGGPETTSPQPAR
jgi:hypothetical protein